MRAVFIGASSLTIMSARQMLAHGHDVILIERDKAKIEALSEELGCGFLHGDGSKPAVLKEINPNENDLLFCLTNDDKANILASLVGRSLNFGRVVTKIDDSELEHICIELGLENTIIPARTIGRYLADMVEGTDPLELSTMIRHEARIFSFVLPKDHEGPARALALPEETRIVCVYRNGTLIIPDADSELEGDDEVVVITHRRNIGILKERWLTR
ncbi:MAG: potassium channel family protein [Gammaproteobacteria bacterium]